MTAKDRKAAQELAISWQAFCEYHDRGDIKRRAFWAGMLRQSQRVTGVEMHPDATLAAFEREQVAA